MARLQYLGVLFAGTLGSYVTSLVLGYLLGRKGVLRVGWFAHQKRTLTDPLTLRLHMWLDQRKATSIRERSGARLFLLIFANNLLVASLRILHGVIFFIPFVVVIWSGLAQGVGYSRVSQVRPSSVLLAGTLEFAAYVVAGVAGVDLGLSLVSALAAGNVGHFTTALGDLAFLYPVVAAFLVGGAAFESRFVIQRIDSQGVLSRMGQLDMDRLRSSLAEALENQPDSGELDMERLRDDLVRLLAGPPEEEAGDDTDNDPHNPI